MVLVLRGLGPPRYTGTTTGTCQAPMLFTKKSKKHRFLTFEESMPEPTRNRYQNFPRNRGIAEPQNRGIAHIGTNIKKGQEPVLMVPVPEFRQELVPQFT